MEHWKTTTLGEIAQIIMGQSPDSKYYNNNGTGVKFLQGCAEFGNKYPNTEVYCSESKKIAPKNSILFSVRAPVGRINFADTSYCIGRGLASIIPQNADLHFVYQYLGFIADQYQNIAQGSTFDSINSEELKRFKLSIPKSKTEQTQIANILSTIDKAIEQTEAIIVKQQRIKTGLMQDLLTKGIDEHGNIRSEATHKFKDSPLGRIPVEWKIEVIGNLFDMILGKMLNQIAVEGKSPYPYLGNKNVQWDYVDLRELLEMDFNEQERKKYALQQGDILICEGGEVGRTALWRGELDNCYFQKAVHRLRPKEDNYLPSLMLRVMRFLSLRGQFVNFTSQTSIAHLTQEKLAQIPIPVPQPHEQEKLVEIFDKFDRNLQIEEEKLNKFKRIKLGLMQNLLTGRVRVTQLLDA